MNMQTLLPKTRTCKTGHVPALRLHMPTTVYVEHSCLIKDTSLEEYISQTGTDLTLIKFWKGELLKQFGNRNILRIISESIPVQE